MRTSWARAEAALDAAMADTDALAVQLERVVKRLPQSFEAGDYALMGRERGIPLRVRARLDEVIEETLVAALSPAQGTAFGAGVRHLEAELGRVPDADYLGRLLALWRAQHALELSRLWTRGQLAAWREVFAADLGEGDTAWLCERVTGLTAPDARRLARARKGSAEARAKRAASKREIEAMAVFAARMRASRIADTETAEAFHRGTTQAASSWGVPLKVWHVRDDEKACPLCAPYDGLKVRTGESFPGAFAPPIHPRCRCAVLFEL